jgi:hypothetical protein
MADIARERGQGHHRALSRMRSRNGAVHERPSTQPTGVNPPLKAFQGSGLTSWYAPLSTLVK